MTGRSNIQLKLYAYPAGLLTASLSLELSSDKTSPDWGNHNSNHVMLRQLSSGDLSMSSLQPLVYGYDRDMPLVKTRFIQLHLLRRRAAL